MASALTVSWENDTLVIPASVSSSSTLERFTRDGKKGATSTKPLSSSRDTCSANLDKGRYSLTVRDDGVVLATSALEQAVIEMVPLDNVEPKFFERFNALMK
jgi:hypothetical protein